MVYKLNFIGLMKQILIIITLGFSSFSFTQTTYLDSLKEQINSQSSFINKGKLYNYIIKEYLNFDLDSADFYINQSLNYNKKHRFYSNYLQTLSFKCDYYLRLGEYHKAIDKSRKGIRYANQLLDQKLVNRFLTHQAKAYYYLNDFSLQYETVSKLLKNSEKTKDTLGLCHSNMFLAVLYWKADYKNKAFSTNKKAYIFAKQIKKRKEMNSILKNSAIFYEYTGEIEKARRLNLESLKFLQTTQDSIVDFNTIGRFYLDIDSLERAEYFLLLANQHKDNKLFDVYSLINNYLLGILYYKKKAFNKANSFFNKALSVKNPETKYAYAIHMPNLLYAKHQFFEYPSPNTDSSLFYLKKYTSLSNELKEKQKINEVANDIAIRDLKKNIEIKNMLIKEQKLLKNTKFLNRVILFLSISMLFVLLLFMLVLYKKQKLKKINKEIQFKNKIELKNKEQVVLVMEKQNKTKALNNLQMEIDYLLKAVKEGKVLKDDIINFLTKLVKKISVDNEKDWEEFKLFYENINQDFFKLLKNKYPKLSEKDLKLCAYIKMQIDTKQIAKMLNILPSSVKQQRNRLRKKMNIPSNSNIIDYLSF